MAVVAAGCGYKQEPTGALKPTFPVTVHDAAGRSIELAHAPQKVVVLDPAGARLLRAIGVKLTLLAPDAPVSQLRAQHPDLLVLPPDTSRDDADTIAQRVGAPTYVLAGFQLALIERGAAQLGLATGHALAGRDLALGLRARRLSARRRGSRTRRCRRCSPTPASSTRSRAGDLLANLVRVAGGKVVGTEQPQPVERARMQSARARRVPARALEQGDAQGPAAARAATKDLAAVRSGRVLILDDRLVAPDQDAYRVLEQIARFLHPESLP